MTESKKSSAISELRRNWWWRLQKRFGDRLEIPEPRSWSDDAVVVRSDCQVVKIPRREDFKG